ncbi:DUF6341 family protein [Haloflavibacter putidus]|uniref:Uracil phosphoribosyltransferase n=1 Tax=Haloflavibacter putidus TaxID=2576776 RepID=A0A507ZWA5_9FLAO|nr:uracil phosphoribosyltransferase [Haloflavibacter putidus]TQD40773.1 uracil phosphoribosyltransferase [Haloflavibacter putidus]
MRDFWEFIASIFEDFLFIPLDALRSLELDSWWAANLLNFVFMLIAAAAFVYWTMQLKKEQDNHNDRSAKRVRS